MYKTELIRFVWLSRKLGKVIIVNTHTEQNIKIKK